MTTDLLLAIYLTCFKAYQTSEIYTTTTEACILVVRN